MNLNYLVPPLVAVALNLVLLVLVMRSRWHDAVHRIFSFFLLNVALWALLIFFMRASPDTGHALRWELAVTAVAFGTAVLFYHFTIAYTRIRLTRWPLVIGYLLWIIFAALTPTGLLDARVQVKPYGFAPVFGPLMGPYIFFINCFTILGSVNLIRGIRISSDADERNRIRYMVIGIACMLLGGITDAVAALGILPYPLGIWGNILFSLITAIAILKYRLLDVGIVFRKALTYFLLGALATSLAVAIVSLVSNIFRTQNISLPLGIALLIIIALALQPLWRRAQSQVDKWFFRERYDAKDG